MNMRQSDDNDHPEAPPASAPAAANNTTTTTNSLARSRSRSSKGILRTSDPGPVAAIVHSPKSAAPLAFRPRGSSGQQYELRLRQELHEQHRHEAQQQQQQQQHYQQQRENENENEKEAYRSTNLHELASQVKAEEAKRRHSDDEKAYFHPFELRHLDHDASTGGTPPADIGEYQINIDDQHDEQQQGQKQRQRKREIMGRSLGRAVRRLSSGALSVMSTGNMSALTLDPFESDDDEGDGNDKNRTGDANIGQQEIQDKNHETQQPTQAEPTWEGDLRPLSEEDRLLDQRQQDWQREQAPAWRPPEQPSLGRRIGRAARRMSRGALSAAGASLGEFEAADAQFAAAANEINGASRSSRLVDAEHGEMPMPISTPATAAAAAGAAYEEGAVPYTIDVAVGEGHHSLAAHPSAYQDPRAALTARREQAGKKARRAVRKAGKMARRMSSGSLYALGLGGTDALSLSQGVGVNYFDSDDDSDDVPEPGDADYVPPPTPSVADQGSVAQQQRSQRSLNASSGVIQTTGPPATSKKIAASNSKLPAWGNASTMSAVDAVHNSRYRPMPGRIKSSRGLGEFDPDNIVTFVDEEEEAMEHEYMMRKRRRRTYIIATVILVAVGLALAGGTSWMFVGWKQNSSGGIGVISDSSGSQQMPVPPSDLDRVCSIRNMATEEGHKDCEDLCSRAMCCMKAGPESCYSQHEQICEMYSPCGALNTYTETGKGENEHIAPPPANLDMLCSDSSLATPPGYLGCLSACHHGSCCVSLHSANLGGEGEDGTTSIQSCRDSHAEVCSAYDPCLNLWEAGHANPVEVVKDVCTVELVSTEEGRDQCESLCKARSCCFALDERNCRLENKSWCEEYDECEVLIDASQSWHSSTTSSSGIEGAGSVPRDRECQQSKIVTSTDLLMCEESCMPAWDCANARRAGIESGSDIDCNEWKYCIPLLSNLMEGGIHAGSWGGSDNSISAEVDKACDRGKLKTSKGKQECFTICEDRMCCFDGCRDDVECKNYSSCKHLLEGSSGGQDENDSSRLYPPPDNLDELCNQSTIHRDEDNRARCQEACTIGQCCMGIGFSCQTNIRYCLQFAACDIVWEPELYNFGNSFGGNQDSTSTTDPAGGAHSFDFKYLCSSERVKSSEGMKGCDDACSSWSCCWSKDNNCFDEQPSICLNALTCPGAR